MANEASTPSAGLNILSPGLLSSLQDAGRFGLRHLGIPWAGALVPDWQKLGNALVGNDPGVPIIESFEGGLSMRIVDAPLRLAVLGAADLSLQVEDENGRRDLTTQRSYTLAPGSTVTLRTTGSYRHAVIAVHGLRVAPQLGSVSTYAKAGLGGLNGSPLQAGDTLEAENAPAGVEWQCKEADTLHSPDSRLRIVLGPQQHHFSEQGIRTLLESEYTLTAEADRMGARLSGHALEHRDAAAKDIVSDAIVPGSIQVPGNGQPIVLLNDAHTAGGYPKIGTVISIDLPLLGLHRAGKTFRFDVVSVDEAIDLVRQTATALERRIKAVSAIREVSLSSEYLLSVNLIDGVTDGDLL